MSLGDWIAALLRSGRRELVVSWTGATQRLGNVYCEEPYEECDFAIDGPGDALDDELLKKHIARVLTGDRALGVPPAPAQPQAATTQGDA